MRALFKRWYKRTESAKETVSGVGSDGTDPPTRAAFPSSLQSNGDNNIPVESSYEFVELGLGRAMVIRPYIFEDERGQFVETFNRAQFDRRLGIEFVQDCVSVSRLHTLRGLHGDFRTWKLIHCPRGSVLANIINLNPSSPTYFESKTIEINDRNREMLLVPPGFGNSFYVLEDDTVYSYKKTTYFRPGAEFTLHYTCVEWPAGIDPLLSKRDSTPPRNREEFEKELRTRFDLENNPFLRRRTLSTLDEEE